MDALESI